MGFEDQARFLTAKYGTAAGPTGVAHASNVQFGIAAVMVILGLLIFAAVLFMLVRDWQLSRTRQTEPVQ